MTRTTLIGAGPLRCGAMRFRAVIAVLLAATLAGCTQTTSSSGPKFTGEKKAVANVVSDLSTAGTRRKPADVCDKLVTSSLRQKIAAPGSDCSAEMKKAMEDADGFDLQVTAVTINGNTATATVKNKAGTKDATTTFDFQKESGGWRISSFGS
jgi:hypothetical protein